MDLEERLRQAWEEGRRRWPDVTLDLRRFAAHVTERLPPDGEPEERLAAVNVTDLYLACACLTGDRGALDSFDRAILSHVPQFVGRLRLSPSEIDEVRQLLRERLLVPQEGAPPRIAEYTGRGALVSWMRVVAVRVALNARRGKDDQPHDGDEELADAAAAAPDPELRYLRERYREEFRDALRTAFGLLSDSEHNLLHMYFIGRVATPQLATLLGVSRPTVSRMLAAAREKATEEARRLLRERLRVGDAELDSLYRAVKSELDLSIRQLLPATRR